MSVLDGDLLRRLVGNPVQLCDAVYALVKLEAQSRIRKTRKRDALTTLAAVDVACVCDTDGLVTLIVTGPVFGEQAKSATRKSG